MSRRGVTGDTRGVEREAVKIDMINHRQYAQQP